MAKQPDIWFNGQLVPHEDAKVHVFSHALHYGSSIFEGIRCYDTAKGSAVLRLDEHVRRLIDSARIYRMEIPYSHAELCDAILKTIAASGYKACYIRPLVWRGEGGLGVNPLKNRVEVMVGVLPWGAYLGDEALEQGVDVMTASWQRAAPNSFPAMAKAGGNYLVSQLVKMDAILNGYVEGIMLNRDGFVAEGSGENLFIVRDGKLVTPPAALSILPGITRDAVFTLAKALGYEVQEALVPREALLIADELFFTGTAAEITPIRSVDKYTIGAGKRGPVTAAIQKAFMDVLTSGEDPYGWLTFVR